MRRVRRVAEQDDVPVAPRLVPDGNKVNPSGGVRPQGMTTEIISEELLTVRQALSFISLIEAGPSPGGLVAFDNERAGLTVKGVSMNLEQSVRVLAEDEGEGVEHFICAEPDISRLAHVPARLKDLGIGLADHTVDPIGGDGEVTIRKPRQIRDFGLELELHPQLLAA